MQAEPLPHDPEQQHGLERQRDRGRGRGAVAAEARHQHEAQHEVHDEGQRIGQRADVLVAEHVEQPLDRADRRAHHEADRGDEHDVVADHELRPEQPQQRLAERQQHDGRGERRPERPLDRVRHIGRQPRLVAERVILGKAMRGRRRHRVVNEGDQRQRLHHGEIDADLFRGAELLQHQHVGVGQQQIEALDQQDRQRDREPAAEIVGLRARLDMAAEPAVQHDHLADHRDPHRGGAGQHRGGGAEIEAEHEGAGGEADDQRLAHDELRHQAEPHPVMRAGDAVLGVGDDEGRQRQAADIERHDRVGVDPRRQQSSPRPPAAARRRTETANVIQRLPDRKPRSSACSPLVRYSGMIFCADAEMPKSIMLPSSSTQVQT